MSTSNSYNVQGFQLFSLFSLKSLNYIFIYLHHLHGPLLFEKGALLLEMAELHLLISLCRRAYTPSLETDTNLSGHSSGARVTFAAVED